MICPLCYHIFLRVICNDDRLERPARPVQDIGKHIALVRTACHKDPVLVAKVTVRFFVKQHFLAIGIPE